MKKTKIPIHKELPSAVLYLDDLEALQKVLTESCKNLEFEVPGHSFESIAELKQHSTDTITDLTIIALDPFVKIEFCALMNYVHITDSGTVHIGLYEKIRQLVERRRRFVQGRYRHLLAGVSAGIAILCLFSSMAAIQNSDALRFGAASLGFFWEQFCCTVHSTGDRIVP